MDVDAERVATLNEGHCPIFEPGLSELVRTNAAAGRLSFTTDLAGPVAEADAVFIAKLAQVIAVRAEDETVLGDVPNVEPMPIPDVSAVDLVRHAAK